MARSSSYTYDPKTGKWTKKTTNSGGSGNSAETEAQITELEAQIAEYQTKEIETTK